MLIYANWRENGVAGLNLFSPKEAQLLFRQLQKLLARNIAELKCESRKTKCWVPWYPLMQLSVKGNEGCLSFLRYFVRPHTCLRFNIILAVIGDILTLHRR